MTLRIVNLYQYFQNAYGDPFGWVVFHGSDQIARFRTRAEARQFVTEYES